jgi:outer membrane immunogenic protein
MHSHGTSRNHFVSGAAALLLFVGVGTAAADGPRPYAIGVSDLQGVTDWSGFYAGGQVGGAWNSTDWTQTNANIFNTNGAILLGRDSSFDSSSAIGGIFGGYSIQSGHWVFGMEGEWNAVNLSDTQPSPFFPATDTYKAEVDWLASIEGRVGYAWDNWLVYGRGGWAIGGIKMDLNSTLGTQPSASEDTWADGWTAGGGAEYMLWNNVAIGLEYEYTELNTHGETVGCTGCGTGVGLGTPIVSNDIAIQSVMARASYYFTGEDSR